LSIGKSALKGLGEIKRERSEGEGEIKEDYKVENPHEHQVLMRGL